MPVFLNPIYLDHNATTPLAPRVLEVMMPYFSEIYGNASSNHAFGKQAKIAVDEARKEVASLVNALPEDVVFTSGATEACNLAIKGLAMARQAKGRHIITSQIEHPAVLDTCRYLESVGFRVTYLPVGGDCRLRPADLEAALEEDTTLIAIMTANNETGTIQPIKELAAIVERKGIPFFSDTTQCPGKMDFDMEAFGVDACTLSAHKFYGPKGVGALVIKKPWRDLLMAQQHGGAHERGARSGTLNVPGIVGMGKAATLIKEEFPHYKDAVAASRDAIEADLLSLPGVFVNGSQEHRIINTTNICFPGVDANVLIGMLKDIVISNGSACSSHLLQASHVLKAMGLNDEQAFGSVRISLGRENLDSLFTSSLIVKEILKVI